MDRSVDREYRRRHTGAVHSDVLKLPRISMLAHLVVVDPLVLLDKRKMESIVAAPERHLATPTSPLPADSSRMRRFYHCRATQIHVLHATRRVVDEPSYRTTIGNSIL